MSRAETIVLRDGRADNRSRYERIKGAVRDGLRSYWQGPFTSSDRQWAGWMGAAPVSSGISVTEAAAFSVSPFASAVFLISWDCASLPLFHFRKLPGGGKERFDGRLNTLLHDQANEEQTAFDVRSAVFIDALSVGNGYCEIVRDGGGRPTALWHIDPHRVSIFFNENGQRLYRVAQSRGPELVFAASDIIHLKGPSFDGGVTGCNTVTLAREALGLSIAAEKFGGTFFSNGSSLGGVLTTDALTPAARENLAKALQVRHQGSGNAHKWLHVEAGAKFTEVGTSPRDSQFIELRTFQLREVARFFRIPVSLLGDLERSTYSNSEQEVLSYYTHCLRPWLVNFEQELRSKLIPSSERNLQTIEHNVAGLLRADSEKRAAYYSAMLDRGVMTINECRELENLAPIQGGSTARVPLNTTTLDNSGAK